ncbi:UNVERIFIED_CONTAM: hypothetical protein PYX00_006344 [Menopon gallinae]|uniref:Protein KTI12 homolog n=1 Tax=Menopon gallinae TaxID=328185 RepID=A0AAW2HUZ7_9NEOP
MPLIVLTGFPSSGKTTLANELKSYFENKDKKVKIICENNVIKDSGIDKNELYSDSKKEKEIRSKIKSDYVRLISPDELIIIDALNYIKGYRYELYCASKTSKTTQCTVHCLIDSKVAWSFNESRDSSDHYTREVFDALIQRYEEPIGTNRWDSPLFTFLSNDTNERSFDGIYDALYSRKPPPPNQSTQCPPLSDSNYLYELDQATQEVVKVIMEAKKFNPEGEVKIPGCDEVFVLSSDRNTSLAELTRMKRQFLTYVKFHPTLYNKNLKSLFVQYLNSNM